MLIFQSQLVVTSCWKNPTSSPQTTGWVMPMALLSGSQNTLKP